MAGAVCADLVQRAAFVYGAIPVNNEMVSDTLKATLTVPAVYILYGKVLTLRRGRAVYNNFG